MVYVCRCNCGQGNKGRGWFCSPNNEGISQTFTFLKMTWKRAQCKTKQKKIGMRGLKFNIIIVKHLVVMHMTIEISLTSISKNILCQKGKKMKSPLLLWYI